MLGESKADSKRSRVQQDPFQSATAAAPDTATTRVASRSSGSLAEQILQHILAPHVAVVDHDLKEILRFVTQHPDKVADGWEFDLDTDKQVEAYSRVQVRNVLSKHLKAELEKGGSVKCRIEWTTLTRQDIDFGALHSQSSFVTFLRDIGAMPKFPVKQFVCGYELHIVIDNE